MKDVAPPPAHPAPSEPGWEKPPSEREAFAAPDHDPHDIITPHAFRVAPALLGLPLATPARRAVAIGIDGLLVTVLARSGGLLLAAVAAVFVYGWLKNRFRPSGRLSRGLASPARVMLALLVFAVAVSLVQPVWKRYVHRHNDEEASPAEKKTNLPGGDALAYGGMKIALKACDDARCRSEAVDGIAQGLTGLGGSREAKLDRLDTLIDKATEDPSERLQLKAAAAASFERASLAATGAPAATAAAVPAAATDADVPVPTAVPIPGPEETRAPKESKPEYSLLKQIYGVLDDLGLSVGWAAAYFTLFTTLWAGQTPGKRIMRIRVVHLSGRPLSYWASFGRFGGYAAGFTTGLLGFLQIYWDPNRQAIQDQVSFTAVIHDLDLSGVKPPGPLKRT